MRCFVLLLSGCLALVARGDEHQSPLGLPVEITDLYIPGSKVEPVPRTDNATSLVIRIIDVKSAQDGYRYTISVYGLDPGDFDIVNFLQYSDTKSSVKMSPVQLKVTTINSLEGLPKPEALRPKPPPKMGGYRMLLIILSILWLVILGLLIFYRKKVPLTDEATIPEPTLREKLEALVTQASKGELDDTDQARLERLIIGHWKRELPEIDSLPPARALAKLRLHAEASPLILKLEQWLHSPDPNIELAEITPLLVPFGKPESDL